MMYLIIITGNSDVSTLNVTCRDSYVVTTLMKADGALQE